MFGKIIIILLVVFYINELRIAYNLADKYDFLGSYIHYITSTIYFVGAIIISYLEFK